MPGLTRKQHWRRCQSRRIGREEADVRLSFEMDAQPPKQLKWSHSWSNVVTVAPKAEEGQERAKTATATSQLSKKVSFLPVVKVVLIPSLDDFGEELRESYWYTSGELMAFKKAAFEVWKVFGSVGFIPEEIAHYEHQQKLKAERESDESAARVLKEKEAAIVKKSQPIVIHSSSSSNQLNSSSSQRLPSLPTPPPNTTTKHQVLQCSAHPQLQPPQQTQQQQHTSSSSSSSSSCPPIVTDHGLSVHVSKVPSTSTYTSYSTSPYYPTKSLQSCASELAYCMDGGGSGGGRGGLLLPSVISSHSGGRSYDN